MWDTRCSSSSRSSGSVYIIIFTTISIINIISITTTTIIIISIIDSNSNVRLNPTPPYTPYRLHSTTQKKKKLSRFFDRTW